MIVSQQALLMLERLFCEGYSSFWSAPHLLSLTFNLFQNFVLQSDTNFNIFSCSSYRHRFCLLLIKFSFDFSRHFGQRFQHDLPWRFSRYYYIICQADAVSAPSVDFDLYTTLSVNKWNRYPYSSNPCLAHHLTLALYFNTLISNSVSWNLYKFRFSLLSKSTLISFIA